MEGTFRRVVLGRVSGVEGGGGGVEEAGAVIPGLHRQGRAPPAHLPAGQEDGVCHGEGGPPDDGPRQEAAHQGQEEGGQESHCLSVDLEDVWL